MHERSFFVILPPKPEPKEPYNNIYNVSFKKSNQVCKKHSGQLQRIKRGLKFQTNNYRKLLSRQPKNNTDHTARIPM